MKHITCHILVTTTINHILFAAILQFAIKVTAYHSVQTIQFLIK